MMSVKTWNKNRPFVRVGNFIENFVDLRLSHRQQCVKLTIEQLLNTNTSLENVCVTGKTQRNRATGRQRKNGYTDIT